MIITSKIQTDLVQSGEVPTAEAMQDDKYSRNLEISLFSDGLPWTVPSGGAAVVRYRKPDGTGGSYDTMPDGTPACTISGSVITAALAPQVCTAPGLVRMALCLVRGETEVNTFAINLLVHRNPGIDAVSEDYTNMSMYVKTSGWTPNMFLATDSSGNVVAVEEPDGTGVTISDVLDSLVQASSISVVQKDGTITFTTMLEGGASSISQVMLGSHGYPSKIITDGVECPVTWEGFDDAILGIWEGGSY